MSKKMNVIFEVGHLANASPATVSRCGMIYLEPKRLGWQPLRDSFLASIKKYLVEDQQESLQDMTEWIIQPCLTFIEENCKTFVATSELHLVQVYIPIIKLINLIN
jgi:dynein heavy chain